MIDDISILRGKNAFISGCTGAIGFATAEKLAKLGCNLFITGQNQIVLEEISENLSHYNVNISSQAADLRDIKEIHKVVKQANSFFEHFDIVINVAGIFPHLNLHDSSDDIYNDTMNVNFLAPFIFSREFSKKMVVQKWGRIVNVGSISSYNGYKSTSLYCSSKHALLGFTRSIHEELKQYNIRAYIISPSSTQSNMGRQTKGQDFSTFLDPVEVAKYIVIVLSQNNNLHSREIRLERMEIK